MMEVYSVLKEPAVSLKESYIITGWYGEQTGGNK